MPTLTVAGKGVRVDPRTVTVYTPADPAHAQDVAFTFNSPFMDTLERCADRMVWASEAAAGPNVQITFDIPTAQLGAFGEKLGARIEYESSIYRVRRIVRRDLTSTVTASRYVTSADLEAAWGTTTIGDRDTFWSGYSAGDRLIQPLLTTR